MNNNEMKFDPLTGKPIQDENNNNSTNEVDNKTDSPKIEENPTNIDNSIQKENINNIKNIATVDQSKDEFINNVQKDSDKKSLNKEGKSGYIFIIIIFAIIFAAIFFLFPIINKYI